MNQRYLVDRVRPGSAGAAVLASAIGMAIVLALVAPVSAQSKWWRADRFKQLLEITSAQSDRMDEIHEAMAAELRDAKIEFDRQEARFSAELKRPDSTEAEVVFAIDRLEAARSELSKLRTLHLYRIRQVLTPEQRNTLEEDFQRNRRRSATDRPPPSGQRRGSQ